MSEAVQDVRKELPNSPISILLRFECKNAFVGGDDLENIFPINREREYLLELDLRKGIKFQTVKARNPLNLQFTGSYYLIFQNLEQACVYYRETRSKVINGLPFKLRFVEPKEQHLKKIASPFLERDVGNVLKDNKMVSESDKVGLISVEDLFASSSMKSRIITQLKQLDTDRSRNTGHNVDPLFELLTFFVDADIRRRSVLVKNLPFGISEPAIENLLWDYELDNQDDPQKSITRIEIDPLTQTSRTLIKFSDSIDAKRFVRNFHGRKWEKILSRKDKALHEPILCEIVD